MSYTDVSTPVIEKIQLPGDNQPYYIADRQIRDVVAALGDTIAGGVSFIIAWDGTSTPVASKIPEGVKVTYNGNTVTGTLDPDLATAGAFYLVKSASLPTGQDLDIYDEYVPVNNGESKSWEKIGDTQLNLTGAVTDVSLDKQTDTVIGSDASFTITQPTISLATGATGTGTITVATGITSANLTKDEVTALTSLGTPSTKTAIGTDSTFTVTQPTVSLSSNASTATGRIQVATDVSATTTNIKATASGAAVTASGDNVTAITGYDSPSTDTFVKTISATSKKLATTSLIGVSGSTIASKATAAASQTTATGSTTASSSNTDLLKGVSVNNGTLTFGSATLATQTTTQQTFTDVTVPQAAANATVVATGKTATTDANGDTIVTAASAGTSGSAVTSLGTASTDTVLGTASNFSVTQPTIALSTNATAGTGVVNVATGASATKTYLGAAASGGNVAWNSKDSVTAVTGYSSPGTETVLGGGTTVSVTPTTTRIKATASGANTEWNNKDQVTVLTSGTTLDVTKDS